MAITTINNRAINRADTAASGESWTATSATASDFQAVGGTNTPAFFAKLSADDSSTYTDQGTVKIRFNTEVFDTDSAYDNSTNYRFTVPVGGAGKYQINVAAVLNKSNDVYNTTLSLYLNGSASGYESNGRDNSTNTAYNVWCILNPILDLSAGDYLECYFYYDVGSGTGTLKGNRTFFGGYKLIT